MPRKAHLLYLIFLLLPVQGFAQTVYVNDTLRVGVRPEPSNDVGPVSVVVTGMKLEVLERSDGYLKIRTDKGVEGWIKNIYVTNDLPARLELAKLAKEHEKLLGQIGNQDDLVKTAEINNVSLSKEIDVLKKSNTELRLRLIKAEKTGDGAELSITILLYGLLFIVLVVSGFALGVLWYRGQAMKRLGGLRV